MSNTQHTLAIIKPDALERNLIGKICTVIENSGLKIVASKIKHLTPKEAAGFYIVHQERSFFNELVTYMSSGPVMIMVLEGDNAVNKYREIMGATNPENALDGTIRKLYAVNIEKNSVHGSDSVENAKTEIAYFFASTEIVS